MSTATDRDNHALTELLTEAVQRLSNIEGQLVGEEGFIKTTNRRLNAHSQKLSRHDWFFGAMTGGGIVILWMIERGLQHVSKLVELMRK